MISHKYRCIFVHIPKTGGTSIEDLIWPERHELSENELWMGFIDKYHNKYQTGGLQHLLAKQIRSEIGASTFDSYFKFAFTRNPWDKVVSQFTYMSIREDLREFIGMKQGDCFKKYLELIAKKKHVQWEPQINFIFNDNGDFLIDYLGRFESFNRSVETIASRVNINYEAIPHSNKGKRTNYQNYYDTESIERVREMYANDIKLLAYDYNQPNQSNSSNFINFGTYKSHNPFATLDSIASSDLFTSSIGISPSDPRV